MPITVTSPDIHADEYNSGSTDVFQGNSADRITNTIEWFYENSVDAGNLGASVKLDFEEANGIDFPFFVGNAVLDLSSVGFPQSTINELLGKEITIGSTKAEYNGARNVVAIKGDLVCLDVAFDSGNNGFTNGTYFVSSDITAFEFQFSYDRINDNDFTGALSNALVQKFISSNTDVLDHTNTSPVTLIFGTVGSYQIGSCTIEGTDLGIPGRQGFKVIHELIIIPVERGDDISLQIDYTNAYKFQLIPKEAPNSNPFQQGANSSTPLTTGNITSGQIRVGLLDTNFGLNTNYSVSNLVIERTSDNQNSGIPIVEEKFTVTANINNTIDSPFSDTDTKVQVAIENVPDDPTSTTQGYEDKFVNDRALSTLGAGAIAGESSGDAASITNYTATFVSASQIIIDFDVDFTAAAETQINAQSNPFFLISCATQNHTLSYASSDRATITVFDGQGINKLLDPPVSLFSNNYVIHTRTNLTEGVTEIDGFPTQDLVASSVFSIDWTGRDGLRLNRILQSLVLKNSVTGEEIQLAESIIPVNSFPLVNGIYPDAGSLSQGTNYNANKGFKIPTDEVRNNIVMSNVNSNGPSPIFFFLGFPFFIRWEAFKQLIINPIPSDLIDTGEPFDGINHFIHRIDDVPNWSVEYRLVFESAESGQNFVQTFDNPITTSDYEEQPNVISRTVRTFKEDKTTSLFISSINYAESTEKTFVKAEFLMNFTPADISDFEIVFFMEKFEEGSPTSIQRISSFNELLPGSWFTDTGAGDGKILKSIDGDKAVGVAYIDNNTLEFNDQYRLYAHIYLPTTPDENMLFEDGIEMLFEDGEIMQYE